MFEVPFGYGLHRSSLRRRPNRKVESGHALPIEIDRPESMPLRMKTAAGQANAVYIGPVYERNREVSLHLWLACVV
jgi:hypothetical protein